MSLYRRSIALIAMGASALVGCAPVVESAQLATATLTPTTAPTVIPATPTPEPTSPGPTTLTIWFPDDLLPLQDETLSTVLQSEINEYATFEDRVQIELRRKTSADVGGIMAMLRSASSVAPGALPDITLMRREDVLEATEERLIQPLEGRIASSVIADLFPAALRLGRADDQLYGLPYLLDFYLYAYRDHGDPTPERWTFETVIDRNQTFAAPVVRANGMADILWLQYAEAGGSLPDGEALELTADAVSAVLTFYEQLEDANLIPRDMIEYATPADYADLLASGEIDSAVVNTGILRQLTEADPPLLYAPVPTLNGQALTSVDGWMWVIVTPNSERQVMAGRFLNWMMDSERHSTYAQAILMPPSQRSSLRRWHVAGIDNALMTSLLAESLPPQPDIGVSSAARALQTAWIDVLTGRLSALQATVNALEQ